MEERWGGGSNDEEDPKEKALPEDPETCLQLNMVYQEVIQEKLAEVSLLLAQNREQQVALPAMPTPEPLCPWGPAQPCFGPRRRSCGAFLGRKAPE